MISVEPESGDKLTKLLLPPYLQELGYVSIPCLIELAKRVTTTTGGRVQLNPRWYQWRGVLEYLACTEHARANLRNLSSAKPIGTTHVVPARYNSAALVFFAQASLDLISVWIKRTLKLQKVTDANCALHKLPMQKALENKHNQLVPVIAKHREFIEELENFRRHWIHKLSGGVAVFSDKNPSEPDAKVQLATPIDPAIDLFGMDFNLIEECKKRHAGRWLYEIDEFGDRIANGTKDVSLDILEVTLKLLDE